MDLATAVEALYSTFRKYERPATFEGCECCFGRASDRSTNRFPAPGGDRPLHEVEPMELGPIAENVPGTGGTLDLYKHYLPRLFEIAAEEDEVGWVDMQIVIGKLRYGPEPLTTWPEPEQTAIVAFLHAMWLERLASDSFWPIESALCSAALVDDDIGWYLDAWTASAAASATEALDQFATTYAAEIAAGHLGDAWWGVSEPPMPSNVERIVTWIREVRPTSR